MQDQIKHISMDRDAAPERAIVLCVLDDEHQDGWTRDRLARELGLADVALEGPLARLCEEEVIGIADETIRASRATTYLSALKMIAI